MTDHDAPPSPRRTAESIDVTVPLEARHAAMLRVVAATIGADVGFSIDEIDDVRLGLSEAFALLVQQPPSPRVRTTFSVDDRELTIRLVPESGRVEVEADELATSILRSVVDRFEIDAAAITLVKRAVEAVGR